MNLLYETVGPCMMKTQHNIIKGVSLTNAPSTAELISQYICFCPNSNVLLYRADCILICLAKLSIIANNIYILKTMICSHRLPQTRP